MKHRSISTLAALIAVSSGLLSQPAIAADTDQKAKDNAATTPGQPTEPDVVHVESAEQLQKALADAKAGQTILLASGTYAGIFSVNRGGTAGAPLTIAPEPGAKVLITAPENTLAPTSREGNSGANLSRTLRIKNCSDVIVKDLTIRGGILIGDEGNNTRNPAWAKATEDFKKWMAEDGPEQKKGSTVTIAKNAWISTMGWVRGRLGPGKPGWLDQMFCPTTQRITVENCDITGRGIALWNAGSCRIVGNKIHDVEPHIVGIVLQFMCFYNDIINNDVSGMYDPKCHWHGEGIRLVNGSCNNLIQGNFVHDIKGLGFGVTTDLFCDSNVFLGNKVARVQNNAFTAQAWDSDNKWINNIAENTSIGFEFSSWWWNDEPGNQPTTGCEVRGNRVYGAVNADCAAARINGYRFADNNFKTVHFSPKLAAGFAKEGGLWDGKAELPKWISTEPPKRDLAFEY